jgi:hypothetical protein
VYQNENLIYISLPVAQIHPLDTIIKVVFDTNIDSIVPITPNATPPDPSIISYGKPTTQSSNYPGSYPASNAVDGNTTSFSHTNLEVKAWWQVDLKTINPISTIRIYNREGYLERLNDFWVYILDDSNNIVWSQHQTTYPNPTLTLDAGGVKGRYVKIQLAGTNYLTLCEVVVTMSSFLKGDADGNQAVNIVDALAIARYAAGMNPQPFYIKAADANGDGVVSILDALRVAQFVAGIIPAL